MASASLTPSASEMWEETLSVENRIWDVGPLEKIKEKEDGRRGRRKCSREGKEGEIEGGREERAEERWLKWWNKERG